MKKINLYAIPAFIFMVSGILLISNCQASKARRRGQETPPTPPETTPSTATAISTGTGTETEVDANSIAWELINQRLWEREVNRSSNSNEVEQWLKSLGNDGKWTDIDYAPKSIQFYPPDSHLERARALVWALVAPGSSNKDKSDLKEKVFLALRILDDYKSPSAPAQDFSWDHWFSNYVSGPKIILQILVLLQNDLSSDQRIQYLSKVPDQIGATFKDGKSVFAESGQNKVWIADNSFIRESLLRNSDQVKKALKSMASTLTIITKNSGEGIKSDFSFHQHGAQIYSGGYGYWFVLIIAETMGIVKNTKLEQVFSPSETEVFKKYVLQGFQWHFFKSSFDFGVVGRNITRLGGLSTAALKSIHNELGGIYPGEKLSLDSIKNHLEGKPSSLIGNRFFFNSDFMVQRGRDFYLSARVPSTRTDGTESINGENLKGYYLPFGTTNILTRGPEYQSIIPVWNWSRLPGVTSEVDHIPDWGGYLRGKNAFAGGVSDGLKGLLTFQTKDLGIQWLKSYFFYENIMICLGAGISGSKPKSILTTINQTERKGDAVIRDSDKIVNLKTPIVTSQAQWVHHDRIGYIMLQPQPVNISISGQKGSFSDISKLATQKGQIQKEVFNLWIDHGRDPLDASYAYGVIADIDQQKTDQLGSEAKLGLKILANRKDLQILKRGDTFFVVVLSAQNVVLEKNLIIDFDQPTLLLLEQKGSALTLALTDPLQDKAKLTLRIMGKFRGPSTKILDGRTQIELELDTSLGNRGRPALLELTPL